MVHRALRARARAARPRSALPAIAASWPPQGVELSRLERRADEADRYVGTFLKCVYLRDRVGQTFDGLITTVMEFGCFVQLLASGSTGCCRWPRCATMTTRWRAMAANGSASAAGAGCAPGARLRVIVAAVSRWKD